MCMLCLLSLPCLASGQDEENRFSWPVDCVPGMNCAGRHLRIGYPDVTSIGKSFSCGQPGYSGHQGTDIIVSSVDQGVAVVAAASGTVRWTRDGLFDRCPDSTRRDCDEENKSRLPAGTDATLGFNAGNFVVLEHTLGQVRYLTLYAHLAAGSLQAVPGQQVSRGQKLGTVGSSGNAQIPHLHFGVYRQEGQFYRPVDPWEGPCNTTSDGLWAFDPPFQPAIDAILEGKYSKAPFDRPLSP